MREQYVVVQCQSSRCPTCRKTVRLLQPESAIKQARTPWQARYGDALPQFYLCDCGYIGQVGVGPVYDAEVEA